MYEFTRNKTYKIEDDGERKLLANFEAKIIEETRIVDGRNTETILKISGMMQLSADSEDVTKLPAVDVNATSWASLAWIMPAWGVRAVVQPGSSIKDDLRTAIQLYSRPVQKTIYRHTGWTEINGKPAYLHAGGAITEKGNDTSVTVQLPHELAKYDLTVKGVKTKEAVLASLKVATLAPPEIGWPLFAATLTPLLGATDFAIHLTGRTGSFKSELISLFQSHYGTKMDARHLPGSWSSTPNALEAQAFMVANAPFTVDDFVPAGTAWQVRAYQATAEKIIRSQGNQSGRARLTDTSNLQSTMYPRGIILSTGEDTPEGHSIRARMFILEITAGDITSEKLTKCQALRPKFVQTIAAFTQWLAANPMDINKLTEDLRPDFNEIGHSRTPSMLARLTATMQCFCHWLKSENIAKGETANQIEKESCDAIRKAGEKQKAYLESSDPCDVFAQSLRTILGTGHAHIRTVNGGIPRNPTMLGWTQEGDSQDTPLYKSHGPCIGWINWDEDEIYIEINVGFQAIKKAAGAEMPLTKQTLLKRLKDSGWLTRVDENRQRNTIRVTAEGHPRHVISMPISKVLETQEVPQEREPGEEG